MSRHKENKPVYYISGRSYEVEEIAEMSRKFITRANIYNNELNLSDRLDLNETEKEYVDCLITGRLLHREKIEKSKKPERNFLQRSEWYRIYIDPPLEEIKELEGLNNEIVNRLKESIQENRAVKINEAIQIIVAKVYSQNNVKGEEFLKELDAWTEEWRSKIPPPDNNINPDENNTQ